MTSHDLIRTVDLARELGVTTQWIRKIQRRLGIARVGALLPQDAERVRETIRNATPGRPLS